INLSLKYYLADSNGIISAFYSTHDGFNFFKDVYASQYCVALWQLSVAYALVRALKLSSRFLSCSHLRL
ncbi:MAG: hypothetical protein IKC37_01020, partial [Clostridia bacterium]|nr:hypothetical protein [Clostridia bacterium]